MPDKQGELTDAEKQTIVDWLKERVPEGPPNCAVCAKKDWFVGDILVAPLHYDGKGIKLGGAVYPNAVLVCKNCANTVFLNAIMMGIIPPKEEEKEEDTEKEADASAGAK